MSDDQHRRRERNAGAFLGPDLLVPVPMSTLDDEADVPPEPEDDGEPGAHRASPERAPEPEPQGLVGRLLGRLRPRPDRPD